MIDALSVASVSSIQAKKIKSSLDQNITANIMAKEGLKMQKDGGKNHCCEIRVRRDQVFRDRDQVWTKF